MCDKRRIYNQFEIRRLIESFEMQKFHDVKIITPDDVVINYKNLKLELVKSDYFLLKIKDSDMKIKFCNIRNIVVDEESEIGNFKINMGNGTSILFLYPNL